MASDQPRRAFRPSGIALALALLLLVVGGGGLVVSRLTPAEAPAGPDAAEPAPLSGRDQAREDAGDAAPAPRTAGAAHLAPSFDVVRVGPGGTAVLAGRATPGDEVVVHDGDSVLGRATADATGGWVLVPDRSLAPGGRELTLSARDPSAAGAAEVAGSAPVLLAVPEPGAADASGTLAVLAPEADAPTVLQAPGTGAPGAKGVGASRTGAKGTGPAGTGAGTGAGEAGGTGLGLDTVDYDDTGHIRFAGHSPVGSTVRLYADNRVLGDAATDAQGRWSLKPEALGAGLHQLRVDQLGVGGAVVARVELPFRKVLLPRGSVRRGQVVVQPGENLWTMARVAYGDGLRYTVILRANRSQIRDPARIYPGQAFTVPSLAGHR